MSKYHQHLSRSNKPPQQLDDADFSSSVQSYFSRPIAWSHTFYLVGPIDNAYKYTEWFEIIRTASPDDNIQININSMGGSYTTALQFRRAMMESNATISCSIEGECHSAASLVYLSADNFSVSEGSSMLIHDYSGIVGGKGSEMIRQIQHEKISIDKFLQEVYSDFLSEEEIQHVLSGQDMWLDEDSIIERTKKLTEIRSKEIQEAMESAFQQDEVLVEEEVTETKPRTRKKK